MCGHISQEKQVIAYHGLGLPCSSPRINQNPISQTVSQQQFQTQTNPHSQPSNNTLQIQNDLEEADIFSQNDYVSLRISLPPASPPNVSHLDNSGMDHGVRSLLYTPTPDTSLGDILANVYVKITLFLINSNLQHTI